MIRRLPFLTLALTLIVSLVLGSVGNAQAYSAGGVGKLLLSPSTVTATTGQNFTVDVMINTSNVPISGAAFRLSYSVPATTDLEVVSITPNTGLAGWQFPFTTHDVSGGKMNIDVMGLVPTPTGYVNNADTKLVTITFKAISAFSGKQLTFDQSQSAMTRKSDGVDILGTLGTGSISASGATVPGTTPTPIPTPTPTPTPAAGATPTPSPTPTTSTTTTTTTTETTPTPVTTTTADTRTTTTTQTQPVPVTGSTATTFALILGGVGLIGGAVVYRVRHV